MKTLEEEFFKKYQGNEEKLIDYGFIKNHNQYTYETTLLKGEFKVIITYDTKVTGKVLDGFDESEYTNFRLHRKLGSYAASVKEAYLILLEDIRNECFTKQLFISCQAKRINDYIESKYTKRDLPFEEDDIVIYRNPDEKWFAVIMTVSKSKLTSGDEDVDIINLKTDEFTEKLLTKTGIYTCYHMSKKKWVSIILDDTLSDDVIEKLINLSYLNTNPTPKSIGEWIVPIRGDLEYINDCFNKEGTLLSKQSAKIKIGDIVYLYLAKPYSSICYKTEVVENNIPFDNPSKTKYLMLLKLIEAYNPKMYPLVTLKSYSVNTIRSTRYMPKELSAYINS